MQQVYAKRGMLQSLCKGGGGGGVQHAAGGTAEARPGTVILDVGANLGLFSLFCATTILPSSSDSSSSRTTIVAVEPIPQIFSLLERNLAASTNPAVADINVILYRAAAGAAKKPTSETVPTASFTYYPDNPGESTRHPRERAEQQKQLLAAAVADIAAAEDRAGQPAVAAAGDVGRPNAQPRKKPRVGLGLESGGAPPPQAQFPSATFLPTLQAYVRQQKARACGALLPSANGDGSKGAGESPGDARSPSTDEGEVVQCSELTISDIIAEHGFTCVDLLKVDVEGDELDVLKGIRDEHWPIVKQVVAEVHDVHNRLQDVRSLLLGCGFAVASEQQLPSVDQGFVHYVPAALQLYMVYATRD